MAEEWLNRKLEELRTTNNRLTTLNEIRAYLDDVADLEIEARDRLLSSPEIYNCMEEEDNKIADKLQFLLLGSDILRVCMENLNLAKTCDLGSMLHRALTCKWMRIRVLALQTIQKEVNRLKDSEYPNVEVSDIISPKLFHHILMLLLEHRENQMGFIALQIYPHVLEHYLDEPFVKETLIEILEKGDAELRFRLYETTCSVGFSSESNFRKLEFVFDYIVGEIKTSNDIMYTMILAVIEPCTEHDYGLNFIERHQLLDVLVGRIKNLTCLPQHLPIILGIMQFFSGVARVQPKWILGGYPFMMFRLFTFLTFNDNYILPIVFEAFANIAHTEDGVFYLEQFYPYATRDIFTAYSVHLKNLPCNMKVTALESLEYMFTFDDNRQSAVIDILQRWFRYLNNNTKTMLSVAKCCRQSPSKVCTAALYVVRAVCFYPWGIEALKKTPGFLKFLLKRNNERVDSTVKYARFNVIEVLSDSGAFDVQTTKKLRNYVNECNPWGDEE